MASPLQLLIARATKANHPAFASLELTYRCNLACLFCYNPVQRKNQVRTVSPEPPAQPPLSFGEMVDLLDQLRDMGVLYLTLTGGEPLLHPQFWDVAWEAKRRTFALRVFSNGIAIDEPAADRFAELSPYCLEISIHGATDATAEALNQVKGSHGRLLRALSLLRERGVSVFLKCVVTRLVEHELEAILELGRSFGYPVYFDPVLYSSMDGQAYPLDLQASEAAIFRLFSAKGMNIGNSPFEAPELNCSVASGNLHIDPYGYVHPCVQWDERIGNVREARLADLWTGSPRLAEIRELNRALPARLFGSVPEAAFCNHCPAVARRESGDPARVSHQHLRVARIRSQAHREAAADEG